MEKKTETVLLKAEVNGTLALYFRDHKGEYMCINCYNAIGVNGRSIFKEHATEWGREMSESIALLANIIYEGEVAEAKDELLTK